MYKLHIPIMQTEPTCVIRLFDNAYIPFAPDNSDYQAYLKWVAEGGVPISAEEQA